VRACQRTSHASSAASSANRARKPARIRTGAVGRVGETAKCLREIDVLRVQQGQEVVGQRQILRRLAAQAELGAHDGEPVVFVTRRERVDHARRERDRAVGVGIEQGQQRLGQARQIPAGDQRLVAIGIAPAGVDRAEDRVGVEVVHEGAGAVVDGFARQGHVVGVHDAVDEAHAHPARDQLGLAFAHRPQQPQIGVAIGRDGRRM
jgi:hypothetical protein